MLYFFVCTGNDCGDSAGGLNGKTAQVVYGRLNRDREYGSMSSSFVVGTL